MQTRSCEDNSVCTSVCLSVKRVHCHKTEEKYVVIFLYHAKDKSSFLRRRMVGGGAHFYLKFWVNRGPVAAKSPILNRYTLVAPHP